jgi:hypothetical protein
MILFVTDVVYAKRCALMMLFHLIPITGLMLKNVMVAGRASIIVPQKQFIQNVSKGKAIIQNQMINLKKNYAYKFTSLKPKTPLPFYKKF